MSRYEYRASTAPSGPWSNPSTGPSVHVSGPGETLVQFRAVDRAGNASGWAPATPTPESSAKIDITAPSVPGVTGGSAQWHVDSVPVVVTGDGSTDTGGSGLAAGGYQYHLSTDGGSSWAAPVTAAQATFTADGDSLVEFRAVDGAGNASAWSAPAEVKIDTGAPIDPTVMGAPAGWVNAVVTVTAAATDTGSGIAQYDWQTSTDGTTWTPAAAGSTLGIGGEGTVLVETRATDQLGYTSPWSAPATIRIDLTAPSVPSTVTGGSSAWRTTAPVMIVASNATDGGSGVAGYQYQTSTDGGASWSLLQAGAQVAVITDGDTLVQFRAFDQAGNTSPWSAPAEAKLDTAAPTGVTVIGAPPGWTSTAPVSLLVAATDATSGLANYQWRTSTDNATWTTPTIASTLIVSNEGTTWTQVRAIDTAGNASAWTGATVSIDTRTPGVPTLSGGSSSWQNVASISVTASGSTDPAPGSGGVVYQYETSTDGGATWTPPVSGGQALVTAQADTLVRFRAVDQAANASPWSASAQARLDRTAPLSPLVSGGSLKCSRKKVTISATGATDALSGLLRYEYRVAKNGGPWGPTTPGTKVVFTTTGQYVAQFRAVDRAANTTAWTPTTIGSADSACIR
jgi:hypothetical protein